MTDTPHQCGLFGQGNVGPNTVGQRSLIDVAAPEPTRPADDIDARIARLFDPKATPELWDHDAIAAELKKRKASFVDVREAMKHREQMEQDFPAVPGDDGPEEAFGFVVYRTGAPNLLVWVGPRTPFTSEIMKQWAELFNPEPESGEEWFIPAFAVAGKPGEFADIEGQPIP